MPILVHQRGFELATAAVLLALTLAIADSTSARQLTQNPSVSKTSSSTSSNLDITTNVPKFTAYKGVHIGMSADDVRKKLGKPKQGDKTQDLYVFSDNESAQVFYNDKQLVYAISIDYAGKDSVPVPADIFGHDVAPKADGSIYQLQQYLQAGYWVSYNRTRGDSPLVTVTIQKIPGSNQ